jgi:hypothetical protein
VDVVPDVVVPPEVVVPPLVVPPEVVVPPLDVVLLEEEPPPPPPQPANASIAVRTAAVKARRSLTESGDRVKNLMGVIL